MTDAQIELERLAKQCEKDGDEEDGIEHWYSQYTLCQKNCLITANDGDFLAHCTPKAIISLLADIRRIEEEVKTMRNSVLEEAAKKCDELPITIYKTGIYFEQCARAIRKMQF